MPTCMVGDSKKILIIDDERLIRWSIGQRLEEEGFEALQAADARSGLAQAADADAVILDYRLPDADGFDVLRQLRREHPRLPVVMLTAHSSVDHAVQAMKLGAYHYVAKPYDLDDLMVLLRDALRDRPSRQVGDEQVDRLLGESPAMRRVRSVVTRIAASASSTVLLTGESGTGKSLVARVIHAQSDRRDGPFVDVTCSAIPEQLLESELFGHEKGSFTGAEQRKPGLIERAHGGTLLLDEIGEMPPLMQAKLLGVLENKSFRRVGGTEQQRADVRVIAATNVELEQAVAQGRFRADLYYRLAVVSVHIPPLRERPEDIPLLVHSFLGSLSKELGVEASLRRGTLGVLRSRPWPGNARQLRNAVERALLLASDQELGPDDFDDPSVGDDVLDDSGFVLPRQGLNMEDLEQALLQQALRRADGNQRVAGEMLGMNRDQVRYRMAKYGIASRRQKDPS